MTSWVNCGGTQMKRRINLSWPSMVLKDVLSSISSRRDEAWYVCSKIQARVY